MTTATYLYCVVRAARKPASTGVPSGVPDATRPEIIAVSPSLWLVAASVPLDVYGSAPLEALLGDFESVGRIAVAHEAVVEHFALRRDLTVIPMKLFTMFSTPARAIADLTARRKSIETVMKRIQGAEEWGVRVSRTAPLTTSQAAGARVATSGASFLAAKKQARDDVRNAKLAAAEAAVVAFDRLAGIARDARRREDPPEGGATPPLLDAAFLVASKDRDTFTDAARREADACAGAGAQMTLTGPWPAYNFVQTEGGR